MKKVKQVCKGRIHFKCLMLLFVTAALTLSNSIYQVSCVPVDIIPVYTNYWNSFPKRTFFALARDGYPQNAFDDFKRSVSILAKNGLLPANVAPNEDDDRKDHEEDNSEEKRGEGIKRNVQALARDGYRGGKVLQQSDKRNREIIHKRSGNNREAFDQYYQNPEYQISEIDGPLSMDDVYELQQTVNPDMFPPLSQFYKRSEDAKLYDYEIINSADMNGHNFKRGTVGMPVQGLLRPTFVEPSGRKKRFLLFEPEDVSDNDVGKRSVGSIPMTRIAELGNMSLLPKMTMKPIQSTPAYRRRHYLLTRTRQDKSADDR